VTPGVGTFQLPEVGTFELPLTVALEEYAPAAVKLAAVGHDTADKEAVARGVTLRLGLARRPAADAADALAIALCHLQDAPLRTAVRRIGWGAR